MIFQNGVIFIQDFVVISSIAKVGTYCLNIPSKIFVLFLSNNQSQKNPYSTLYIFRMLDLPKIKLTLKGPRPFFL